MRRRAERGEIPLSFVVTGIAMIGSAIVGIALVTDHTRSAHLIVRIVLSGAVLICCGAVPFALAAVDRVLVPRRDERGSATGFVVALGLALLVVGGVVIDGGYTLGARREAMNQAEQAARAGSDALNEGALRDGTVRVDPGRAIAAANAYLARVGAHGHVSVIGDEVTVTVTSRQDTKILSLVGVGSLPVEATASAVSIGEND